MSPIRKAILKAVASHRGVSSSEIRKITGRCEWTVCHHLQALESAGHIYRTRPTGSATRWLEVGTEPTATKPTPKKRTRMTAEQRAHDWAEKAPVKRVVPALNAPRLRVQAARSVWEWR